MPAGVMIPARNMPSMIGVNGNVGGFGSSSGLALGQVCTCVLFHAFLLHCLCFLSFMIQFSWIFVWLMYMIFYFLTTPY
jgi:hypothetical protein